LRPEILNDSFSVADEVPKRTAFGGHQQLVGSGPGATIQSTYVVKGQFHFLLSEHKSTQRKEKKVGSGAATATQSKPHIHQITP
jgi:hypothetical protein